MAAPLADQGLYSEKPDVNVGRLATSVQERKEWVASVGHWREIETGVSFAESERRVTVYLPLPGIQDLPQGNICVWLTECSAEARCFARCVVILRLEVRVVDLHGHNFVFAAPELYAPIDAEASEYRVGSDKVVLKLAKRASARGWDRWERIRR
uniref:CS domain-containing protein n=1 Tax=Oxyrrhis marina TaxID=2969 RepID=A0A7S3UJC1_OXYMA